MLKNVFEKHSTFIAILIVIAILALSFGALCLMGWITMLIYNAIAAAAGLPTFSLWVWVGVWFLISCATNRRSSKD